MRLFGGIDPGVHGAIAFYAPDSGWIEVHDVPTFQVTIARKLRHRIDIPSTLATLGEHGSDTVAMVTLEQVNGRPRDTPTTAFTLGECVGVFKATLAATRLPWQQATPAAWMRHFGLSGKAENGGDDARELAMRLFPDAAGEFRRKKDHNRAEAALIALYTAQTHKG